MGKSAEIRVMVVDDHFYIRYGLVTALGYEMDIQVVAQAGSGSEALVLFSQHLPDVLILDGSLPDMHGTEVAQRICARHATAQVLLFSVEERPEDIYRAVHAGVRAYVPKSAEAAELLRGVRALASGQQFFPTEISRKLRERQCQVTPSERELEVLNLMAAGLPNKLIADRLHVSAETVKTYIGRILEKLGAQDRTQAVMVAVERGLIKAGH
jgi:two-component system NarL family response regulator